MEKTIWATTDDGTIEFVSLTKDLLPAALLVLQQSFYLDENVCVALDMPRQPGSFAEMDKLLINAAKDGVSIAAVERATGKVVAAAFNKCEESGRDFYNNFIESCKYSASRNVAKWMCDIASMCDVHALYGVKNEMEIMFLGVLPEFRKRGIAKKLFEVSIEVAKNLKQGNNVKVSVDDRQLELNEPPGLVSAICTSFVTQKIANSLNFITGKRVKFEQFVYDGINLFADKETPYITFDYYKL